MTLSKAWWATMHAAVLVCVATLGAFPVPAHTAEAPSPAPAAAGVDYAALIRDLTLTRNVGGKMTMAIWLPDEFWRVALQNSGRMTDRGINDYLAVVHPYTLVAVLKGERGITAFRFTDPDVLANEVTIEDSHGASYGTLPADSVAEDVRNLIQLMRPLLSNMMGSMGEHMEFLVFPSLDKAGHYFADPKSDGTLTIHIGDESLRYRLPLESLLPPAVDPKTGEAFPGGYRFNPYTGGKLVQQPAAALPAPSLAPAPVPIPKPE